VFHGHQSPGAAETGADTDFQGNFLVRRPSSIDTGVVGNIFEDFSAWGARIGRSNLDSRLKCPRAMASLPESMVFSMGSFKGRNGLVGAGGESGYLVANGF
jgi:hypothetical protein